MSYEGPANIQYKCRVPIYVFPEIKLCSLVISKNRIIRFCLLIVREIYFQDLDRSVDTAAKYVDRSWEYINRSQTHECRNRDRGCVIPFWEYVHQFNFRYIAMYETKLK
jgi:hypothetical protein